MTPGELLLSAGGALLLLLLAADVFTTVFQPGGHGGWWNRRQNRWAWGVFRAVGLRGGPAREGVLALGGPVLAVLTPTLWVAAMVAGFAMIYYPHLPGFRISPGSFGPLWVEALYYSGFTGTTLGTGDLVAASPALRLLSVFQAFAGFALVTASLTYVLSVFREQTRMSTLAAEIRLRLTDPAGAARLARAPESAGDWGRWLEEVARRLLWLRFSHAQYPILHYFRSREADSSLPVQLGRLAELLDALPAADDAPPALRPGLGAARAALERYLGEVDDHLLPSSGADDESTDQRLRRLRRYMGFG